MDSRGSIAIGILWVRTTEIARETDADLVLTGNGGDHLLDQAQLFPSYVGARMLTHWYSGVRAVARAQGLATASVAYQMSRPLIPEWARTLRNRFRSASPTLVNPDLAVHSASSAREGHIQDWGMPSRMQNKLVADAQHPMLSWINESQEAEHAAFGIGVSHPFFDRDLYEFVLSIPLAAYPSDGRSKALIRQGFRGHLPDSVVNRTSVTVADEYLSSVFAIHAPQYHARYPSVSERARPSSTVGRTRHSWRISAARLAPNQPFRTCCGEPGR